MRFESLPNAHPRPDDSPQTEPIPLPEAGAPAGAIEVAFPEEPAEETAPAPVGEAQPIPTNRRYEDLVGRALPPFEGGPEGE